MQPLEIETFLLHPEAENEQYGRGEQLALFAIDWCQDYQPTLVDGQEI